jgi:hypothetical protein
MIIREYFEKLYPNKLEYLEQMYKFLDTHDQPELNKEDINQLNRSITISDVKAALKGLPKKKRTEPDRFTAEFYQTLKELIPTLLKPVYEIDKGRNTTTLIL